MEMKTPPIPESTDLTEEWPEEKGIAYKSLPNYEPTLDLRDYKYPTLDLLKAYEINGLVRDTAGLDGKNTCLYFRPTRK
jgi:S-DNA-T family DNA segregation ATPase FtsK/SpoIIIE